MSWIDEIDNEIEIDDIPKSKINNPTVSIKTGVKSWVEDIFEWKGGDMIQWKISRKQVFEQISTELEKKHGYLRKISSKKWSDVSDMDLDNFAILWFIEILPWNKVWEHLANIDKLNIEIGSLKEELEEDFKKWRVNSKRLEHLLRLEKASNDLFKICSRKNYIEHKDKFNVRYGYSYSSEDDIMADIYKNTPSNIWNDLKDKISESLSKIKVIQATLNSFLVQNWRHVRITKEWFDELPEERNLDRFLKLRSKISNLQFTSDSNEKNSLTFQLLSLWIKNPEKQDEFIDKFKEIRILLYDIQYSGPNWRNNTAMQMLNLILKSPEKQDEFIAKLREIRSKLRDIDCSDSDWKNILAMELLNLYFNEPDKFKERFSNFLDIRWSIWNMSYSCGRWRNELAMHFLKYSLEDPVGLMEYMTDYHIVRWKLWKSINFGSPDSHNNITFQFLRLYKEAPENIDSYIATFKEIYNFLAREIGHSSGDWLRNIAMRILNMHIKNPSKTDEFLINFKSLRDRLWKICSNADGQNILSMQLLSMQSIDYLLRFRDFSSDYSQNKEHYTDNSSDDFALYNMFQLIIIDMMSEWNDFRDLDYAIGWWESAWDTEDLWSAGLEYSEAQDIQTDAFDSGLDFGGNADAWADAADWWE
ncbi:MAG: hypothetical protein ACD_3C00086G0069 [uncultured bacterium (gcode 4)]|uniref:Uncharacterized protein n=1 Tax=uncultured bacterium (gcode 4) TaxID=1234023 RepID=K2GXR3_9BACT|nr:MAG: hypothetical protein ACD_3C00086G0069 [uncultured bacterium (gcode 4)]